MGFKDDPITDKQIEFIKMLYSRKKIDPETMKIPKTKGDASILIDELKEDFNWK